jgi:hypothetical protein
MRAGRLFTILVLVAGASAVVSSNAGVAPRGPEDARAHGRATRTFVRNPRVPASAPGCGMPVPDTADAREARKVKRLPVLGVKASDFAYVESADRIYATVAGDSPKYPNTLVEAVPRRKNVVRAIQVAPNPRWLAVADDNRTAYVVADGPLVQMIDLATGQIVSSFVPQIDAPLNYPLGIAAIAVAPGRPETIALSFYYVGITGGEPGIAVYDSGVRRPAVIPDYQAWSLTFSDAGTLWIYLVPFAALVPAT